MKNLVAQYDGLYQNVLSPGNRIFDCCMRWRYAIISHGDALGCWLLSFGEAEEAFKMSPGQDTYPKLSVKKTVVLLKTVYLKTESSSQRAADGVGISTGWVKTSLCERLLMIKICAWRVPQILDQKMKDCWCEELGLNENQKLMQLDWNLFVRRIVTGDESWINHYDPRLKEKHAVENTPVLQALANLRYRHQLAMCTVFCDAEGIHGDASQTDSYRSPLCWLTSTSKTACGS